MGSDGSEAEQTRSPSVWMRIPSDPKLLQAAGKVAIAHGHLEHILRMMVKTLARLDIDSALYATQNVGVSELRNTVKKLFKSVCSDEVPKQKLAALLGRSAVLTKKRNELIHRAWGQTDDDAWVVKGEHHDWGAPPTPDELESLAAEIADVTSRINTERLEGFIRDAVSRAPRLRT